ncbi:MAG TPA: CopD family protein [Aldersonia sp.]
MPTSARARWALLLAVPATTLGVALGWALAAGQDQHADTLVRAATDGLAATVLGLGLLPRLNGTAVPWRVAAGVAAVWTVLEILLLVLAAGAADDVGPGGLSLAEFGEFVTGLSTGRVDALVTSCAAAAAGYAAWSYRGSAVRSADPVVALSAIGLVLRPVTGHLSQQPFGSLLGAAHTLAAAAWFGLLVAISLVARSRRDWAALLPAYSTWALRCVAVVAASGVVNALVREGSLAAFVDTGYGRMLLAKVVLLTGLVGLGWWWRRTWVRPAAEHRVDAEVSLRRAVGEVAAMAVVFGLAAALATAA